ncbi:hypothetical protein WJX72_010400 [[Myrmecia] bisecta]|uniref:Uncharacterized protein n=1 Tax=[Myrmecia] bisecta TaxID=41462 RepID=A0AAW1P1V1_9CHLO
MSDHSKLPDLDLDTATSGSWKGQARFAEKLARLHGRVQELKLLHGFRHTGDTVTYPWQTYAASLLAACSRSVQKLRLALTPPGQAITLRLLANMRQLRVLWMLLGDADFGVMLKATQHVEEVTLHGANYTDTFAKGRMRAEDADPMCNEPTLAASLTEQPNGSPSNLPQRMRILRVDRLRSLTLLNCNIQGFNELAGEDSATIDQMMAFREPWSSQLPPALLQMVHLEELTINVGPYNIGNNVLGDVGNRFPQLRRLQVHFDAFSVRPTGPENYRGPLCLFPALCGLRALESSLDIELLD